MIVSILLFIISLVISLYFWVREGEDDAVELDQKARDRFAEKLNSMAQKTAEEEDGRITSEINSGGKFPPFALYLRPFALDKKIRQPENRLSLSHILLPRRLLVYLLDTDDVNFDFALQTHFHNLGLKLVNLGSPNDLDGGGHVIVSDDLWRDRFRQLAERATTIIVVPGYYKGIISEIRWLIVTGLLVNTVFKPKGYPKAEWKKMQELYEKEEDIELPDYSHKLMSFRMYSSGRCYDVTTWSSAFWERKNDLGNAQMGATLLNKPRPRENDQGDE